MALLNIFDVNAPTLRAKTQKVNRITPSERKLLDDMVETMRAAGGIGLAAPQVGVLQRLIVVETDEEFYALVNPEVADLSDETDVMDEGCLSMPNYYGPVERPIRATVRAMDKNGKRLKIKAEGLLARVLQHEIDHLDGILFFDPLRMRSLNDLRYIPPKAEGEEEDQAASAETGKADAQAASGSSDGHTPADSKHKGSVHSEARSMGGSHPETKAHEAEAGAL